jgi:hypothetical protein
MAPEYRLPNKPGREIYRTAWVELLIKNQV